MDNDKKQAPKQSLYEVISMRDFKPDQRMIREALGVQSPEHGGRSDNPTRVPVRPR